MFDLREGFFQEMNNMLCDGLTNQQIVHFVNSLFSSVGQLPRSCNELGNIIADQRFEELRRELQQQRGINLDDCVVSMSYLSDKRHQKAIDFF